MAFYKYFWDLASSTTYTTHTVATFDANCTSGSGTFRWVPFVSNTAITNIPGIRIKPTAQATGYWERVYDGPVNVGWFGCQNTTTAPNTFGALGVSQSTLDARYGAGFATVNDYYDTTAIRYALSMMSTTPGHQTLMFEPKTYWISKACELPVSFASGGNPRGMFIIDGNGANIRKAGTDQFNFFQRIPANNTDAVNLYIDNAFTIKNFKVDGSGGTWQGTGFSFLYLGATYGSIIENIFLQNLDIAIRMEFCMGATVTNIFTNNIKSYSVWLRPGSWTGAALANASSNVCEISHVRVFDSLNQIAGIAVQDSDTTVIRSCVIEGTGSPQYGILWDSLNATVAPNVRIQDHHIETACSKAAIYLRPRSGGRHIVDNIYVQYAQNLVACEFYSGYPDVYIANIPTHVSGLKFLNVGTGTWDLYNVRMGAGIDTAAEVVDPANNLWDTTTVTPSGTGTIPNVAKVRVVGNIITA
jgi:hypothetical protein